jgi:hypothetical protein
LQWHAQGERPRGEPSGGILRTLATRIVGRLPVKDRL